VNLSLINVSTWSVAAVVATGLSNTGSYAWNLPANLPCPGTYQFYIEDTQATTWTYGPSVTIDCCPTGCFQPPSGMVGWWPLDDATNQSTVLDLAANHQGTARDLANNIVNIGPPPVWSLPDPAVFGGSLLPVVTDPNTSNPRAALCSCRARVWSRCPSSQLEHWVQWHDPHSVDLAHAGQWRSAAVGREV
jgi:hypothetical protein